MIKLYEKYVPFTKQLQVPGYIHNWLKINNVFISIVPNVKKHGEQMWDVKISTSNTMQFLSTTDVDILLFSLIDHDLDLALSRLDDLANNYQNLSEEDREFTLNLGEYVYKKECEIFCQDASKLTLVTIEGLIAA